jgi:hypothetical protein
MHLPDVQVRRSMYEELLQSTSANIERCVTPGTRCGPANAAASRRHSPAVTSSHGLPSLSLAYLDFIYPECSLPRQQKLLWRRRQWQPKGKHDRPRTDDGGAGGQRGLARAKRPGLSHLPGLDKLVLEGKVVSRTIGRRSRYFRIRGYVRVRFAARPQLGAPR